MVSPPLLVSAPPAPPYCHHLHHCHDSSIFIVTSLISANISATVPLTLEGTDAFIVVSLINTDVNITIPLLLSQHMISFTLSNVITITIDSLTVWSLLSQ
ncbi:hypothetical protein P7K49_015985 [Saguinus oedipus]|uniref:Uncharacterized protein n=1 Tax=Saguinus oedipus TaxID=9490 RepID=A0ABQ9VB36_SAGOE|nr:hypothetical protein P7K49_015985 [Saguinus oedipus]